MSDTFRPIPGYPGYAINEDGEIVSFISKQGPSKTFARFLKPTLDKSTGYLRVGMVKADGQRHMPRVHVLVALTYLGERPEGYDIDHKDGNKLNNSASNLRYVTRKENQCNPNNLGKNGWQKYGSRKVIATKDGVDTVFNNCKEMCEKLDLWMSNVSSMMHGKSRCSRYKGYTFRWEDEIA